MSESRHLLINTVPAPEATEATKPGNVSDLATPGKGVSFDLYQQPVTR
jgi:hypothetical protein